LHHHGRADEVEEEGERESELRGEDDGKRRVRLN